MNSNIYAYLYGALVGFICIFGLSWGLTFLIKEITKQETEVDKGNVFYGILIVVAQFILTMMMSLYGSRNLQFEIRSMAFSILGSILIGILFIYKRSK